MAIWALAAWSAGYWILRFAGATPSAQAPGAVSAPAAAGEPANVARVFGPAIDKPVDVAVAPVVVDPSTRFALVGVVAGRSSTGVALLSVEGKPARPYRVGSTIDDGYTLKSVSVRSATLTAPQTGATFTVNLPAPATGPGPAALGTPVMPGLPVRPAWPFPVPRAAPADAASTARPSS